MVRDPDVVEDLPELAVEAVGLDVVGRGVMKS
jgi:hypothetical protein